MSLLSAKFKIMLTKSFDEINSKVDYVNHGGCGFFAKHLYDALKLKGFEPELVILIRDWSVQSANEHISNNSINKLFNTGWAHVMVKLNVNGKPIYIDVKGIFSKIEDHPTFGHLDVIDLPYKMLGTMLTSKYKRHWNNTFNRLDSKKIKNTLREHLLV